MWKSLLRLPKISEAKAKVGISKIFQNYAKLNMDGVAQKPARLSRRQLNKRRSFPL